MPISKINTTSITDNSVTAGKIVAGAVDADIAAGSIDTAQIADDAVTADKLANAINTSIDAKLPLAGGTMTGVVAGFTSTGIDDNATSNAITIDASENVGIGVTPEAWHSAYTALDISPDGMLMSEGGGTHLGHNVWSDGTWKYKNTRAAAMHQQTSSGHNFLVAPSGTADAAISWTTAMTIDSGANVFIPTGNLRVTNLVITTKQIDLTTSLQDLIQVGNRASYKITVSVGDGSAGGRHGHTVAFVSCSNDYARQGTIRQETGTTLILSWKTASGTSADAHTLQARNTDGTGNQCTIMVETLSRYASASSGTGNGQSSIQL